ncbi:site-specific DNA-methyltransferase [Latilactobacillus sakei]|uniref:site-specific DNA-methyltransferase n=3 Tax=Latilactobacillus sakei TaxID=1599 RepID=UPI000C137CC4|nr:site-specific DNA-methyltransferase [Latilactobacillus sakei]MDN4009379.1 site-specific DNA-methyltransferase [Latilactobacillus sakei]UNC21861.1 site-specific DNA-methyltransferase [Latilactobacillus sakei]UNC23709.1 site-specific DNA-methyltransferase [Latilactobacillus sakei]SOB38654.1 Adenine-specific DNA-methyltransferase [Latilactobacillus sakei]
MVDQLNEVNSRSENLTLKNIEKIKELFPEILTEKKIDFDKLRLILGDEIDDSPEKYSFTWNGKKKAMQLAQQPTTATLKPNKEKSKNWDETQNIYIEGDNLEVLKLLQKSYADKVKMIYIDPPYNTGKDFVYKDNFKDSVENYLEQTGQVDSDGNRLAVNSETNGRYHTDWLNMMYPRLKLAKNLMTKDGMIFISIDDSEQANLKKVCDEIFGEINFIGSFIVNSTPNARDYGHIGKMHEFVLFYSKDINFTKTKMLPDNEKVFSYEDSRGKYNIHPLYNSNEAFDKRNRPNLYYPFYLNPRSRNKDGFYDISLEKDENFTIEIYPPLSQKNKVQFVWRWGKEKSLKNLNNEIIGYSTKNEYRIVQKMRHSEKLIRSIISGKEFTSRRGTAETEELMQGKLFSFPKPIKLIQNFIEIATESDSVILDFFSGSGTTAEAVMKQNSSDKGNRKYIMVQLPEKLDKETEAYKDSFRTIPDIAEKRIDRAGDDIRIPNQDLDIGFKVFELDKSNIKKWNSDSVKLNENLALQLNNIKSDSGDFDLVYEIMLKQGLDLSLPVEKLGVEGTSIFKIAFGSLFIVLGQDIRSSDVNIITGMIERECLEDVVIVLQDTGIKNDSEKLNIIEDLNAHGVQYDNILSI